MDLTEQYIIQISLNWDDSLTGISNTKIIKLKNIGVI